MNKLQEDIASLKTQFTKSDFDLNALYRDLTNQNIAARRVLIDVKEENSRIKRAFEMEKRLIADNVNFLKEEVKTLDSTLVDVNTTLSSLIPELIVNFDNTKRDFISTLNGTKNDFLSTLNSTSTASISMFAGYLDLALQYNYQQLSNISSEFVQMGHDFNETLGSVEENVKIGISTSITKTLDNKMNALENSLNSSFNDVEAKMDSLQESIVSGYTVVLSNKMNAFETSINSKLTNVFETKMNSMKYSIESGYASALSSKISDLKSYISSEHTSALSRFSTIDSNLNNIASTVAATRTVANDVYWTTLHLHYFWPDYNKKKNIRLANATKGKDWAEGRLEVSNNGVWGTVCDDGFDDDDADAVCEMFTSSADDGIASGSAKFGRGTGPIWLDELECSGSESSIWSCSHRGAGVSDCHHGEDVSLYCTW